MNQVFAGVSALVLALILWSLGKKPLRSLASQKDQNVLDISSLQKTTLVASSQNANKAESESPVILENLINSEWEAPKTIQEQIKL